MISFRDEQKRANIEIHFSCTRVCAEMASAPSVTLAVLAFAVVLAVTPAHAFYLPGVAPQDFAPVRRYPGVSATLAEIRRIIREEPSRTIPYTVPLTLPAPLPPPKRMTS